MKAKALGLFLLAFGGGLGYSFYFHVSIPERKQIYTSLILSQQEKKINSAWVLYHYYPFAYFYLFEVGVDHHVYEEGNYVLLNQDDKFFKKKVQQLLGINSFDFTITLNQGAEKNILNSLAGTKFINLHSKSLPLGKVFIDELNYDAFLEGISDPYLRKNTKLSIWLNIFLNLKKDVSTNEFYLKQLKQIFNQLDININYPSFLKLLETFLTQEDYIFYYDKMNFNQIIHRNQEYLVPLSRGNYDKNKIKLVLSNFINEEFKYELFPIDVQIKNATKINRLATKATGVFRYKRLNVIEYLNSNFPLKNSVIVSHVFYPLKENYVKKITKINETYHLIDYNDEFQFSIYLGNDFYGIKNLKQ